MSSDEESSQGSYESEEEVQQEEELNDDIDWMIHDILVQDCGEGSAWDTCALPSWQLTHPGEALRADQRQSGGGGH